MFTESAELYDAIYNFRDYATEASQIASVIRRANPGAKTVLDVACGTGEHVRRLAQDHQFAADGVDIDAGLLAIARRKYPAGAFGEADMSDLALGRRYDAIISLFSSIGYLLTLDRVRKALGCFRDHLSAGGVIVVEPWFTPGVLEHGRTRLQTGVSDGLRVERTDRVEVDGRVSRLYFDYRIEGPDGVREMSEVHELGLFTADEMRAAFEAERLMPTFDPVGLTGRGLWIASAV